MEYPNKVPANPVVSVCVTTYNHGQYIAETLESIIAQKVEFPIEILIGEDDSTDNTRSICKDFADRYPNLIRLQLNERKNVIHIDERPTGRWNLKNLFKKARGKYIAFIEGDDYFSDDNKLALQVEALERNSNCTICCTGYEIVFQNDLKQNKVAGVYSGKFDYSDVIRGKISPGTCTLMFRNLPDEYFPNWFDLSPFGDMPLIQIHLAYGDLVAIDSVCASYRIHDNGYYSGSADIVRATMLLKTLRVIQDNIKSINPRFLENDTAVRESGAYYRLFYGNADVSNKKVAIKYFLKYIQTGPFNLKKVYRIILFPFILMRIIRIKPYV